ncbi:hypothetical protein [Marinobacter sp. C2H3]|uniref:hypothetical protein n=1 Tax=Marinobacter sp. C2H3 TaxID=3119003 RepID=UPI00300EAD5D
MKRVLLVLAVLVVAGLATAQYRISSGVTEGLEAAKRSMYPYVSMEYGDVDTTLDGKIEINKVLFTQPSTGRQISTDRIALDTGSLWALFSLKDTVKQHRVPEQLSLVIEGLGVDSAIMSMLDQQASGSMTYSRFDAAGCGDRDAFSRADMSAMGFSKLTVDMTVGYHLLAGGDEIKVTVDSAARDLTGIRADMTIRMPRPINDGGPSADIAQNSVLTKASVKLTDLGANARVQAFCKGETGLSTAAYLDAHMNSWKALWKDLGLKPSNSLVAVYNDYIQHPGSTLTFSMEPFPPLELGDHYISPDPAYLSDRLNPKLGTESTGLRPIRVTEIPAAEDETPAVATAKAEPKTEAKPAAESALKRTTPGPLAISELDQHLRHDVRIWLNNGRRMDGRIQAVAGQTLTLKRYLHGGTMVVPVSLGDIRQVSLR